MASPLQQPAIETHPQRDKIIEALLNNESPQSIAKWINPRLNHTSIWRYRRNYIIPKLQRVEQTTKALHDNVVQAAKRNEDVDLEVIRAATQARVAADPLLSRIDRKYADLDSIRPQAIKDKDFDTFFAADKAETAAMRLHAELTGRLQQNTQNVQVQIVVGDKPSDSEPIRLDDAPEDTIDMALPHSR